jgi:uncharacterized protein YhfF
MKSKLRPFTEKKYSRLDFLINEEMSKEAENISRHVEKYQQKHEKFFQNIREIKAFSSSKLKLNKSATK